MNFKRLLKFTLSGLLLTATATAYAAEGEAAEEAKAVTLANGTEISWTEFVNAINNPSSIKGGTISEEIQTAYDNAVSTQKAAADKATEAANAYSTAQKNLTQWQSRLTVLNGTKEPVGWLKDAYEQATAFDKVYQNVLDDESYNSNTIQVWYQLTSGRAKSLTIAYTNPGEGYTPAGETELYTALAEVEFKTFYVYVGSEYPENNGRIKVGNSGFDYANVAYEAQQKLQTMKESDDYDANATEKADLIKKINELSVVGTDGKTGLDKLEDASTAANAAKAAADAELETAKATYDAAVAAAQEGALSNYQTVTLTGDVTATVAINNFSSIIYGEGHVITLEGINELFGTFNGTLANIAINGNVFKAQGANASYTNVAYWNGSTGAFREDNTHRTSAGNLAELGFAARDFFGVDFGSKLVGLSDASKVYSLTFYTPNSTTQKYVQVNSSKFIGEDGKAVEMKPNMFAKSETYDLDREDYNFANVFYANNHCPNVVIKDREQFYCPEELTTGKVTYDRTFKAGMNPVCLPFDLAAKDNAGIEALCTYDKETAEKFWFKRVAEEIPANTPFLMVNPDKDVTLDLDGIVLKKTPETQMIMDEGDLADPSKCYGLLKKATREEFQGGASEAHKVYGMSGGVFTPAAEKVNFPAFRIAIYSNNAQPSMIGPRSIGIVDEKGVEITDDLLSGVESVDANASALDITTGVGEINITTDADHGMVEIYSIDGQVAAMADVKAGTTTVNVQTGIYIVMGKKVMVK